MKKLITAIIAIAMLTSLSALAETAYVTISNGLGEITLAREAIEMADTDNDGVLSIYDALVIAHDQAYEGGSEAGFIAEDLGYGLSLYKLWGEENGGSYGYYVNNASAFNLTDAVADGDHIKAYAYIDLTAWSDSYCHFDKETITAGENELVLTALTFDASWNLVAAPVEGAMITIDGEDTGFVTDAEGKVTLTIAEGSKLVSARSESMVLVPPICIVEE